MEIIQTKYNGEVTVEPSRYLIFSAGFPGFVDERPLSCSTHPAIQINGDIEIKILAIEGDQARFGIIAPQAVDVHRKEVYVDIQEENNLAANTPENLLDLLND